MNGTSKENDNAAAQSRTLASLAEESRRNPLAHAACDENENELDSFQVSSSGSPSQHLLWNNCVDYHTLDAGVLHELVTCCTRMAHNMCEVLRMSFYVACVGAAHQHASPAELHTLPPDYLDYGKSIPITQFHATARTVVMNTMDRLVRYMNEQEVDSVVARLTQMLLDTNCDNDEEEEEEEEKNKADGPRKSLNTNNTDHSSGSSDVKQQAHGGEETASAVSIVVGALAPSRACSASNQHLASNHTSRVASAKPPNVNAKDSNANNININEEDDEDDSGRALWDEVVPQVDRLIAAVRLPMAMHDKARTVHANGTSEHTPRSARQLQRRREQLRHEVRTLLFSSLNHVLQNPTWHTLLHHIIRYVMHQFERIVVQRYGLILRLKLMEYYNGTRCELELPASNLLTFQLDHTTNTTITGSNSVCPNGESPPRVSLDDILYDVVDEHYQGIMRALDKEYACAGHALTEAAEAWERSVHRAPVTREGTAAEYFVQPVTEPGQSVTSNPTIVNAEYSLASHPGPTTTTQDNLITSNGVSHIPVPLTAANVQSIHTGPQVQPSPLLNSQVRGSFTTRPTTTAYNNGARYAVNTFELTTTTATFSPRRESTMMNSTCNGHAYAINHTNTSNNNGGGGVVVPVSGPLRGMEDSMTEPPSSVLRPAGPLPPSLFMFWNESLSRALSERLPPICITIYSPACNGTTMHNGDEKDDKKSKKTNSSSAAAVAVMTLASPLPGLGEQHTRSNAASPQPAMDTADTFAFLLGDWAEQALTTHHGDTLVTHNGTNNGAVTDDSVPTEAMKLVHDVRRYESLIESTAHVALQHYILIHRSADRLFSGLLIEHCRTVLLKAMPQKNHCVCCCTYCLDSCMATLWSSDEPCSSANNTSNGEENERAMRLGQSRQGAIPLAASLSMPSVGHAKTSVSQGGESSTKSRLTLSKKMTENSCRCTLM